MINAHALYIAPAEFHPALEPLLQHRTAQGYQAKGVDVQTLYDAWSYGEVDPTAIRNFLRYAVAHGNPAPIAAVLVGDGTWDPHDYQGYGISNAIPPYMADVDPWLGETACENCYAQLDGDDPLSESAFLTDIWLGRFPVITVSELETVVAKIIAYETAIDLNAPLGAPWRGITVQLADNYIRHNGQTDPAGNFPGFVEGILAMQPPQMHARRHYYNPAVSLDSLQPNIATLLQSISRWLEPDPVLALRKSIAYMNDGASLVTFTGHGNHWKWATTDPASTEGRLFGLWDVLQLQNKEKLFIALSMTCYTAQFPKPEAYHFTLDEHLLLHPNGGAVAVWGPAGLSVAHGHDALQTGFYTALWQAEPYSAKLGALIQAGYRHLVTKSICCQDVARTFLLLGDPLTPALVNPVDVSYMPEISTRPLAQ